MWHHIWFQLNRTPMISTRFRDSWNYAFMAVLGLPGLILLLLSNGHFTPAHHYLFVWNGTSWYFLAGYVLTPFMAVIRAKLAALRSTPNSRSPQVLAVSRQFNQPAMGRWQRHLPLPISPLWDLFISLVGLIGFPILLPGLLLYWGLLQRR